MNKLLIIAMAASLSMLSYADHHEKKPKMDKKEHAKKMREKGVKRGMWKSEDCKKVSDAAGMYLYVSGELAGKSKKEREEGKVKEADKTFEGAWALASMASFHAESFEAFCKK